MQLKIEHEGIFISGKTWGIELRERWTQFFKPKQYNWLDFDFFHLGFEVDRMCGEFNFDLTLFGLCCHIGFVYNPKQNKVSFEKYDKEFKRLFDNK